MEDNTVNNTLLLSLKNMVQYCRDIRQLLDDDITRFNNNAMAEIMESNQHKSLIAEKLASLVNNIHQQIGIPSRNFLETLEAQAAHYEPVQKNEFTSMINELKLELSHAYQALTTNSNIVLANLQQLHAIWERLTEKQEKIVGVYDHKGSISSAKA